ncbi:MAG: hypothetical protein QOJ81_2300 [Chloroflexota bacterium]|nr:hypothetical protein [Chloroflexota bacterium]
MSSTSPEAEAARRDFHEIMERKGHAVDNARDAVARLEQAFAAGDLRRNSEIDGVLADLSVALEQDAGQKLGGKSAEAARFISRRLEQLINDA